MDVPTLTAFVKVVQAGSFTRAADALGTQKAHLSRVVAQLEKELGVRVLERTTRSLSLTEVGRELFERAIGILAAVDDARRAVQHAQGEPRGTLRLTCGVEFGLIAVSGWIDGYLKRYPKVQIDADFTGRIVDLVHEGFDLAIRVGPLADSSLAARKLGELHYGLFAARAYLDRRGVPRHPQDLQGHDLIAFSGGSSKGGWILTSGAERAQVSLAPRLRVNNSLAVRDAASEALGIAQLPLLVAQPQVDQGRLVPVLATWNPSTVPVHAVFASARYLTPKVRAFIDHAVDAFQVHAAVPA
jgi:DNA-binding transcriptional LysR family regulator